MIELLATIFDWSDLLSVVGGFFTGGVVAAVARDWNDR